VHQKRANRRATSPAKPRAVGSGEKAIWSVRLRIGRVSYPLCRQPEPTRTFAGRYFAHSHTSLLLPTRVGCRRGVPGEGGGPNGPGDPGSGRGAGAGMAAAATPARGRPGGPPPTVTPAWCPQAALQAAKGASGGSGGCGRQASSATLRGRRTTLNVL